MQQFEKILIVYADWFALMSVVSLILFVGTLVALPTLVAMIPQDYFVGTDTRLSFGQSQKRWAHVLWAGCRNLIGFFLVIVGIILLFLPGQGILTMIVGLFFMDFPGKYCLEQKLVRQPNIAKVMNWMRAKKGRPPLQIPE